MDTVSDEEIKKGNQEINFNFPSIKLTGRIEYNFDNEVRVVRGQACLMVIFLRDSVLPIS